jgi:hypothetical protein
LFVAGPLSVEALRPARGFDRSVFALETDATCIRWCGPPQEVAADLVHAALQIAASWTAGSSATRWFLDSACLAPNHWFMPVAAENASPRRRSSHVRAAAPAESTEPIGFPRYSFANLPGGEALVART